MKKLFLMRGPSSCGKTTLIKNLGLEANTLSVDVFRTMLNGCEIYGENVRISNKDSYKVFKELYRFLEKRMEDGLLTIIDHTNLSEINIEKYRNLCKKYGYECIVVNFKKSLNEILEYNKNRTDKYVSEDVIRQEYSEHVSQKIPSFCKIIKPENLKNEFNIKFSDLSKYKKIIHIGDIHGCATVLKQALKDMSFENFYIFTGDYIDRGIQNIETLKFLISLNRKPNVVFLKGNHELNLIKYINEEEIFAKSFMKTKDELEKSNIPLKDLRDFCKSLRNYYAYNYQGTKVICSHGGISSINNIALSSEYTFIIGSGDKNITNVDEEFSQNCPNFYQIHGHRNPYNVEIMHYKNSFNLEGAVETGGYLRVIELVGKNNFTAKTFKNDIFDKNLIISE